MGNKTEATLYLFIKDKVSSGIKTVGSAVRSLKAPIGIAIAALSGLAVAMGKLALRGNEMRTVREAFNNLAISQGQDADKMLAKMRELSAGTITDLNLMKQANQALLLGLPVDRFGDMVEIARSSAKATGQSMEFMLNSIVTGLGRGSKLMLDNLGIVFDVNKAYDAYASKLGRTADQLTDAEKKQAFINKALEVGSLNAKKAGSGTLDLKDKYESFKVTMENLANKIGSDLVPTAERLTDILISGAKAAEKFYAKLVGPSEMEKLVSRSLELQMSLSNLKQELKNSQEGSNFFGRAQGFIRAELNATSAELERVEARYKQLDDAQREIAEKEKQRRLEGMNQLQETNTFALEQQIEQDQLDIAQVGATEQQKLDIKLAYLQKKIEAQKDADKKQELLTTQYWLLERKRQLVHDAEDLKMSQAHADARVAILAGAANLITAIAGSGSKAAFLAQKAAAIAQTIVATNAAAAQALIVDPTGILSARVELAGHLNLAAIIATAITGLADGGIVKARPGGTPFIIGEGGKDEAVIPLDKAGGLGIGGNTITINSYGGMLGDESQAREFAIAVDRELLRLRQSNESQAFDQGIV